MAPTLFARQIIDYDEEQLDKYLEENEREVTVEDPENLPTSFIHRLRDRTNVEGRSGMAASHPIDMEQVSAKLAHKLTRDGRRRISTPPSDASLDPEDELERDIQKEEDAYEELVRKGGRPLYHISKLHDVATNPGANRELWLPWHKFEHEPEPEHLWDVFAWQLRDWDDFQEERLTERRTAMALATFNEEAEKRRRLLGFTRSFTFLMDKALQDPVTTWAEYLDYACRLYVQHGNKLKLFRRERSMARTRYLRWILSQFELFDEEMAGQNGNGGSNNSNNSSSNKSDDNNNNQSTEPTIMADTSMSAPSLEPRRKHTRDEAGGDDESTRAVFASNDEEDSVPRAAKRARTYQFSRPSTITTTAASSSASAPIFPANVQNVNPQPSHAQVESAPSAAILRRSERAPEVQRKQALEAEAAAARLKREKEAQAAAAAKRRRAYQDAAAANKKKGQVAQAARQKKERDDAAKRKKAQEDSATRKKAQEAKRKATIAVIGARVTKAESTSRRQRRKAVRTRATKKK